jgi:hypothetical protein
MNFQKLCSVILESKKKDAPRLGALGKRVADAAGPAGYAGGSSGFGQPVERVPLTRWELDADAFSDPGAAEFGKKMTSLKNAFNLLSFDPFFDKKVKDSLNNMVKKGYAFKVEMDNADEPDPSNPNPRKYKEKKYKDEETAIKNLPALIDKVTSEVTGLRTEYENIENMLRIYKNATNGARESTKAQINELEREFKTLRAFIEDATEKKTGNLKAGVDKNEFETKRNRLLEIAGRREEVTPEGMVKTPAIAGKLKELRDLYDNMTMTSAEASGYNNMYINKKDEYEDLNTQLQVYIKQREKLLDKTNQIGTFNKEQNDNRMATLGNLIVITAKDLLESAEEEYVRRKGNTPLSELYTSVVDWSTFPKTLASKIKLLHALTSDDPSVNPVLQYIEYLNRTYDDMQAGLRDQELNPNENITTTRMFEYLPFVRFGKTYVLFSQEYKKTARDNAKMALGDTPADVSTTAYRELMSIFNSIKTDKDILNKVTSDSALDYLKDLINKSPIDNNSKEAIELAIEYASEMNDIRNIKTKLQNSMKAAGHDTSINESFANFTNRLLNEFTFDQDDYELDILELKSLKKRH